MKKMMLSIFIVLAFLISSNTVDAKNDKPNTNQVRQRHRMRNQPQITDPNLVRKRAEMIRKHHQQRLRDRATKRAEAMGKFRKRLGETKEGAPHPALKGKAGKQMQKVQAGLIREQAKYLRRNARLLRIRELAKEQGKQAIIDRVEKLLQKERLRYSRKRQKLTMKKRNILRKQSDLNRPVPFHERELKRERGQNTETEHYRPIRVPKQNRETVKPQNTEQ